MPFSSASFFGLEDMDRRYEANDPGSRPFEIRFLWCKNHEVSNLVMSIHSSIKQPITTIV